MFSRRSFLGGLTVVGTLLGRPALGVPATFRMVYFGDFAPFSQIDASGRVRGLFVDAVQSLLHDRLGMEAEHRAFPWARAQAMVRSGEADGFITVPTPERLSYVLASARPLFEFPMCIVAAGDSPRLSELRRVRTLEGLRPFRLAHYLGSGWADSNLRPLGLDIQWTSDLAGAMRLVANGRVDAMVDNAVSLRHRMQDPEFRDRLVDLPASLATQPYHVCIGRNSPFLGLMPRIDAQLAPHSGGNGAALPIAKAT